MEISILGGPSKIPKPLFSRNFIRFQLFWSGFIVYILGGGLIAVDKKTLVHKFFSLVVITSVFQCFVAITQYFTQHSLGLAKLGEMKIPHIGAACFGMPDGSLWIFDRLFSVARGSKSIIRAYGTLPHPNVLGGFLVFSLFATYYLYQKSKNATYTTLLSFVLFFQTFSLFTTYSRSALFGWIIGSIVWFALNAWKAFLQKDKFQSSRIRSLALIIFTSFGICFFLFYPQLASRGGVVNYTQTLAQGADVERIAIQSIATSIVETKPLTGVGFNSYVLSMAEYGEASIPKIPVHNIFLLVTAETGILGLICFFLFLSLTAIRMVKRGLDLETITLFSIFIVFMFIGCCDYYLIDRPEGKPMFFITLGLIAMMGRKSSELVSIRKTVAVSV
ncbi:MAG: O-antigen ligase family protein [Chlamydiae bacterium]|nr:O-antigen ligase family protein [Chlamydiota bacterium]